jgi:hypothetical protein
LDELIERLILIERIEMVLKQSKKNGVFSVDELDNENWLE